MERTCSSLYVEVPFHQDLSYLSIGERTNANGSKAFREAMLAGNTDDCVEIAKGQARDGAHVLDLCVDYVGRDGSSDMQELAGRLSTAVTLPVVLDSTEPQVLQAGLEKLAGRCIINSVNYEDGDGPTSRFGRVMPLVAEHGAAVVALTIDEEGQARTAEWKLRVASRLIDELTGAWGMDIGDILVDCLTFPIATGQEETRRDGIETIEAIRELKRRYPGVRTTLGVSNVSFGLNPAARMVLNSVFLHECVAAGLDSAIVHSAKIIPMDRIPEEQREVALDLVWDRRRDGYDPLTRFLELFEGVTAASVRASRAAELAALPLEERLRRRIIDGEAKGLEPDLDEALAGKAALDIINEDLLAGMKVVGELFGSGQMQLPFVLQSAEVMKAAVAHLEPHIDKVEGGSGKGTFINTIAYALGDYADTVDIEVFLTSRNDGHGGGANASPEIAKLAGIRAAMASESGIGRKLNEAKVKNMTGRDDLTARFLHGNPFTFSPVVKFVLSSNYLPSVHDSTDDGMRRRLVIAPFMENLEDIRDIHLKERLKTPDEMAAVLAWCVDGCLKWQKEGLGTPPRRFLQQAGAYYADSDTLQQFLDD